MDKGAVVLPDAGKFLAAAVRTHSVAKKWRAGAAITNKSSDKGCSAENGDNKDKGKDSLTVAGMNKSASWTSGDQPTK